MADMGSLLKLESSKKSLVDTKELANVQSLQYCLESACASLSNEFHVSESEMCTFSIMKSQLCQWCKTF